MSHYLPVLLLVLLTGQSAQELSVELSPSTRLQQSITTGERHRYTIKLGRGDYTRAVVLQKGVDLVVTAFLPSGEKIIDMDSPNGTDGNEQVSLLADEAGVYRLEVALLDQKTAGGSYELSIEPIRPLTEADRRVAVAEKLFAEAARLSASNTHDPRQALEVYAKAAHEAQLGGDKLLEAYSRYFCGAIYRALGEHMSGVDELQRAIELYAQTDNPHDEARALYEQGDCWRYSSVKGRHEKAIACYDRATVLFEKAGDTAYQALAVNRIGLMLEEQIKYREALERYEQAAVIFRKLPYMHKTLPVVLNNIANLHINLWNEKEAEATLKEVLELAQTKQPIEEARAYLLWGRLETGRYRMNAADEYFRRAIDAYEKVGMHNDAVATMKFSGLNFFYNGEYDKALALLENLPKLGDAKRNASVLAEAMLITAIIKRERGEVGKALEILNAALKLARESGSLPTEFSVLFSLTTIYVSLGDYTSAIQKSEEASRLMANNEPNVLLCLSYKGTALEELGQTEEAREVFEDIFNRIGKVSDPIILPMVLNNSGYYYQRTGNLKRSIELFERSIERLKSSPNAHNLATMYNNLVRSYMMQGDLERAEDISKRAYEIVDATGSVQKSMYYLNRAEIHLKRNLLKEALSDIERSVELLEWFREGVSNQDLRTAFFARTRMIYELYVEILLRMGGEQQVAKALAVSERSRARTLLDTLQIARADISKGISPELHRQESMVKRRLSDLSQQQVKLGIKRAPKEVISAVVDEMGRVQEEYMALQSQIRAESPAYAALTQPLQIDLDKIRREVIDSDTVLLEYMLTERQSYLWVVTSDSIQLYQLPSRAEIERIARPLYDVIAHRSGLKRNLTVIEGRKRVGSRALAQELSKVVLLPALKGIKKKRLLIAADGVLQYIPFAMLPLSNGEVVISSYEVINIPSALTLTVTRQERHLQKPQKEMIVIADPVFELSDPRVVQGVSVRKKQEVSEKATLSNLALIAVRAKGMEGTIPRLLGTRLEANRLKALFKSGEATKVTDFDANRELALSDRMNNYRIIHFATHGFVNTEKPELSGLILSLVDRDGNPKEGYLLLQDVYNLNLPAEIVVLSACQTGLGKEIRGEGMVGLTRGFMHAGARRVLVSLWSVSDKGTVELMTRFYRGYTKRKLTVGEALRQAQLSMLEERRWRDPFFWAAFQLQGD